MMQTQRETANRGFLEALKSAVEAFPEFGIYVKVLQPFWRRSFCSKRKVPVLHLELDQDTWEILVIAPGLIPENEPAETAMVLASFYDQLSLHVENAPHCCLVFSDKRPVRLDELREMANSPNHEYTGVDPKDLQDEELDFRLDLPPREIRVRIDPESESVTLLIKA